MIKQHDNGASVLCESTRQAGDVWIELQMHFNAKSFTF